MRTKRKTKGQKIADTMTVEKFMNELSSSFVGKLFEGENGEPEVILLMQKYLDEGRGSSLEQILMSRAIGELIKVRQEMANINICLANLTNPATCFKMGVKEEEADRTLSVQNILDICREDEQNQLAEMLHLQEEANENNKEFNKGNMK